MSEKTKKFELLEPPSPDALVPDSWMEPWMIVVAVVLLFALLALLFLKKKKTTAESLPEIRKVAHAEAVAALEKITSTQTRDVSVQCSLIVRKYLSAAAGDPSLFETHEEYLARHGVLVKFTDEARSAAGQGFSRLATLKYAREIPEVDAGGVIAESRALLETLHHGFQA